MPGYLRPNTRRLPTTLRPLSAELSPLSRSDGSASLQVGNTHVLCAVHGPMAPRSSRWERYDRGVVSVSFSRGLMAAGGGATASTDAAVVGADGARDGVSTSTGESKQKQHPTNPTSSSPAPPASSSAASMKSVPLPPPPGLGATERELEYFLRDALSSCILLERYPRCVLQVVVQIVRADGCVLGSAVNCAVLALMDAGVAMGGLPVAATCVVVPECRISDASGAEKGEEKEADATTTTTVWLDPTAEEEAGDGHAIVVLVTDMASSSSTTTTEVSVQSSSEERDGGIITSFTFGAALSLAGLLSSVESAKRSSAAMVTFMRLAMEQKVQREVQTLWS